MAKKQYTSEEYKAKLDKKAEKNKRFSSTFLKVLAFCLAIAMVYCATSIAYTRTGTYGLGTSNTVAVGNQNSTGGDSVDNNDSTDWGSGNNTQTPSTDNNTDASNDNSSDTSNADADGEDSPPATVMTSNTMQFELFVKAFTGVKKNAASVTNTKKNQYNYKDIIEAYDLDPAIAFFLGFLESSEPNETYTGDDIMAKFPPAGAICGLTKENVKNINCKEEGNYYIITLALKNETNPTAGKGVGSVASVISKEQINEPLQAAAKIPLVGGIIKGLGEPACAYENVTCEAKIEKDSGKLVEYYFSLPMILSFEGESKTYRIGLAFEEWWTVAY